MSLSADVLPSPITMNPPSHSPGALSAFASPRTPQNTPPNSAKRRLVRPLLQQRKYTLQQQACRGVNAQYGRPVKPSSISARYSEEALSDGTCTADVGVTSSIVNEKPSAIPTRNNDGEGGSRYVASQTGESVEPTTINIVTGSDGTITETTAAPSRYPTEPDRDNDCDDACAEMASIHTVHCPPIRTFATDSLGLRATQPHMKRILSSRPGPLMLPRADTPMSLASYPSNLSLSPQANSSASSSFAGISSASKPGNPPEGSIGPKLSSPSVAFPGRVVGVVGATNGNGMSSLSGRPVPTLLRSSLSTHTSGDGTSPSSGSSYANRANSNGPANVSPRLGFGPTPPHIPSSTASVTSNLATSLGSSRSSSRPSFLRTVIPAPSVTTTETFNAPDGRQPLKENNINNNKSSGGVGVSPLQWNDSNSNSWVTRAVNGRVLASPHGVRRPELGARRTTFDRTGSIISAENPTPVPWKAKDGENENGQAVENKENQDEHSCGTPVVERAEPTLAKEMRSFVLGQYRTLQREVLSLPTVAEKADAPVQTDVTAADLVHIKKRTCPRHSKAAKRAEQKKLEEERLRALQQQHHDMEIIRNGGREQVGVNMKSSTMLAGSLSKLRSRHKSSTVAGSAERTLNSLDRTISAAFESEGSPFGSPDEVNGTALYGENPFSSSSPEKVIHPPSEVGAVKKDGVMDSLAAGSVAAVANMEDTEAWHSSKYFMAARTTAPGTSDAGAAGVFSQSHTRRSGRTINKNGMKGEAIVVAVMPDSDDEEDSDNDNAKWSPHLVRTKGSSSLTDVREVTVSVASASSVKGAGEHLPSQRQQPRGATLSASSLLLSTSTKGGVGGNGDSSSSDDDACFSFNKLRSQRLRSGNLSLSSSQALARKSLLTTQPLPSSAQSSGCTSCRPGKMLSPSKESSSEASGDEGIGGDDENACCFCCPCRRPENFLVLCRASSQNGSFAATQAPVPARNASPARPERDNQSVSWSAEIAVPAVVTPQPGRKDDSKINSDSRVMFEDLEDADDDEPLLSMQSFRRTSIQRVR